MIKLKTITDKHKLTISKGLCDYEYIMSHSTKVNRDFKAVYFEFYLKARWSVITKPLNSKPYFRKLMSTKPTDPLIDILDDLKMKMASHNYEFSLGSKLLHTKNPFSPIYDRKVRNYLSDEEGVDFWWHHSPMKRGASKGLTEKQKIEHDWIELNKWYASFIASKRGKRWIKWFDSNFPSYLSISDVKKIDFIIIATR